VVQIFRRNEVNAEDVVIDRKRNFKLSGGKGYMVCETIIALSILGALHQAVHTTLRGGYSHSALSNAIVLQWAQRELPAPSL
jgi:hypothetical protein